MAKRVAATPAEQAVAEAMRADAVAAELAHIADGVQERNPHLSRSEAELQARSTPRGRRLFAMLER